MAFLILISTRLPSAEYFVNKQGDNANDGKSREKAFLTIQNGLDAIQAGDILTIGPGEYFESARRNSLGSEEKDTLIRAEIRGTALMRGDVPAPAFRLVEGCRFVYAADFDRPAQAVNEVDSLMTMARNANFNGLEYQPGGFCYDAEGKKLYISTTDLQPPDRHFYTVSVIKSNGLWLEEPRRVIVDGLAFTGFNTDTASGWGADSTKSGLFMEKPVRCVVRHCVAFLNSAGLMLSNEGVGCSNVIENCVAYGNYSPLNGEGCNIQVLGPDNDTISGCYGYMGRDHNISMYGRVKNPEKPSWIKNCLAWGGWLDIQQKSGGTHKWMAENCVALNTLRAQITRHCLFGQVDGPGSADSARLPDNSAAWNIEFADPENLDFRLQGSSKFRGNGTNGCDLGAFLYQTNIYYVSSAGSNASDGLSARAAWKTLEHAITNLNSGDTLYLEPGAYACGRISGLKEVSIRGRGTGTVRLDGKVEIIDCSGLSLERIGFSGAVEIRNCVAMRLKNCAFDKFAADGAENVRAEHCVFTKEAELEKCEGVSLAGNVYAAGIKSGMCTIEYSDYNAYPDEASMRAMPDGYSHVIRAGIELRDGAPVLSNAHIFAGRGPNGTALGIYNEFRRRPFPVAGPFVSSVSATTANLEWWTSQEGLTELAWGDTPDCPGTRRINTDCYNSFSLTGLQPGKEYYFRINSIKARPGMSLARIMEGVEADLKPVSFKTAEKDAESRIYYVAPDGKALNTGLSRAEAVPTIGEAAGKAGAGDTVLIAGGTYREIVHVRATGAEGRPVTFKSLPGEKVILDGDKRTLSHAIRISGKHYLNFDGLYFTGHGYGWAVHMNDCNNVRFRRCMFRHEGAIRAAACSNMVIENCVISGAMEGVNLQGCSNTRYEHNVSFVHLILHGQVVGGRIYCANNIFTDNQIYKLPIPLFIMNRTETFAETNNCYFLRIPDAQRKMFRFYGYVPPPRRYGFFSLAEYNAETGRDGQSLFCDPQFKGLAGVKVPPYKGTAKRWEGLTVDPALLDAVKDGTPGFPPDHMPPNADFDAFFATSPEVVKRGIGLQPEAFKDFGFEEKQNK